LAEIGQKMISKKLYPAPGVKQLAWYLTPGVRGITVTKAETVEDISNKINLWSTRTIN